MVAGVTFGGLFSYVNEHSANVILKIAIIKPRVLSLLSQ